MGYHISSALYIRYMASFIVVASKTVRPVPRVTRTSLHSCRHHRMAQIRSCRAGKMKAFTNVMAFIRAVVLLPAPDLSRFVRRVTLGRLVILILSIMVTGYSTMTVDEPFSSSLFLHEVAVRAAWISITQIPLVFLLSSKHGPINLLAGLSYDRVNWMHKWIGRILFASVTVHVVIIKSSISMRDIIQSQDEGMAVVRWGVRAYATLIWVVLTSLLPLRRWSYGVFFINHWIAAIALLIVIIQHVPAYARIPIYLAMSFLASDKFSWAYYFCRNNVSICSVQHHLARFGRVSGRLQLLMGYSIEMTAPSPLRLSRQTKDSSSMIKISKLPFSWTPGQHFRLYVPVLGSFEMHPFIPASCSASPPPPLPPRIDVEQSGSIRLHAPLPPKSTSEMHLIIRTHSGFTKRLADYYEDWLTHPCPNASESTSTLTAYVDGPYGHPPVWEEYESLILITSSTGIAFTLSILNHLEQLCFLNKRQWKTKTVTVIWVGRHDDPYLEENVESPLLRCISMLRESGIEVDVEFYFTCPDLGTRSDASQHDPFEHLRMQKQDRLLSKPALRIRNPDEIYEQWDREAAANAQQLKGAELVVDSAGWQSFGCEDASEISTLVENSNGKAEEDPFSDVFAVAEENIPQPSSPFQRQWREKSIDFDEEKQLACQCGLIQHQRQKLNRRPYAEDIIRREYATRPNLPLLLSEAIPRTSLGSTMVAVCANEDVTNDVRRAVAKLNIDFVLGRRVAEVDIFTQGFS